MRKLSLIRLSAWVTLSEPENGDNLGDMRCLTSFFYDNFCIGMNTMMHHDDDSDADGDAHDDHDDDDDDGDDEEDGVGISWHLGGCAMKQAED